MNTYELKKYFLFTHEFQKNGNKMIVNYVKIDQLHLDQKLIGINLHEIITLNMKNMNLQINSPLDMHLHLRDNEMLNLVAPLSAKYFS